MPRYRSISISPIYVTTKTGDIVKVKNGAEINISEQEAAKMPGVLIGLDVTVKPIATTPKPQKVFSTPIVEKVSVVSVEKVEVRQLLTEQPIAAVVTEKIEEELSIPKVEKVVEPVKPTKSKKPRKSSKTRQKIEIDIDGDGITDITITK